MAVTWCAVVWSGVNLRRVPAQVPSALVMSVERAALMRISDLGGVQIEVRRPWRQSDSCRILITVYNHSYLYLYTDHHQ